MFYDESNTSLPIMWNNALAGKPNIDLSILETPKEDTTLSNIQAEQNMFKMSLAFYKIGAGICFCVSAIILDKKGLKVFGRNF